MQGIHLSKQTRVLKSQSTHRTQEASTPENSGNRAEKGTAAAARHRRHNMSDRRMAPRTTASLTRADESAPPTSRGQER